MVCKKKNGQLVDTDKWEVDPERSLVDMQGLCPKLWLHWTYDATIYTTPTQILELIPQAKV